MSDRARWLALGFVVAVSAFFNAAVFLTEPVQVTYDSATYILPADELVRHHVFSGQDPIVYGIAFPGNERIGPDTMRTPGYPLFLAAILALGLPLTAALVIQHALAVALTAATFLIVDVLLHRRAAAIVAALLVATNPATLEFVHHWMSDVPCAVVVLAAMLCTWRLLRTSAPAWAVAAGLLTGCATLIRPIAIGWFVPLTLIVAIHAPRRWVAAAVFFVAALVLPAGWTMRNYAVTGVPTISSIAGEDLLLCNAAGALALRDRPLSYRLSALQQQLGFFDVQGRLKRKLVEQALAEAHGDGLDPLRASHAVLSRYYERLGRRILVRHIPESAALAFSGFVEMLACTWLRSVNSYISPLLWLTLAGGVAMFAAACLGVAVLYRRDPALALLLAATIVYFVLPAASAAASPRFAIVFMPAYAIAAGLGIDSLLRGDPA